MTAVFESAWLPLVAIALALVSSVGRTLALRRRGIEAYVFDRKDGLQSFMEKVFRVTVVLVVCLAVLDVVWFAARSWLGVVGWLDRLPVRITGGAVAIAGAIIIVVAQVQMGASWRIGVPETAAPLRTNGLFGVSRNPIFVGMLLILGGAFLHMPNAAMLALALLGAFAIAVQVRVEEAFLEASHGDAYRSYTSSVRRWL